MALKLDKLIRDSLFYLGLIVISRLVSFISIPILTRLFTPFDYGIIESIGALISLISSFLVLGMSTAIFRYFPNLNINDKKLIISTAFWFRILFSACIVIISIIFSSKMSNMLFQTNSFYNFIIIALLAIPSAIIIDIGIDLSRLTFNKKNYAAIFLSKSITWFPLMIFLVIYLRLGLIGLFYSQTIALIIISLYAVFSMKDYITLSFSIKYLSRLLKFGIPLILTTTSLWVSSSSDRFFLARLSGLSETGIYGIGYKLASIITFFTSGIQLAFSPIAYSIYEKKEANKFFNVIFAGSAIIFFSTGIFLSLFSFEILSLLVPNSFYEGHKIVGLIVLSIILNMITYFVSMGVNFSEKTKYLAYTYVIGAAINILMNITLIPQYGMIGAAFATLLSYLAMSILGNYWGKKCYKKISYPFYKIIIIISLFLLLYGSYIIYKPSFAFRFILGAIYLFVLLITFSSEIALYHQLGKSKIASS
jgi:O-antigen/teichoic acid export membrane protein